MARQPVGETSLQSLLSTLKVTLQPATFVFITLPIPQGDMPLPIPFQDILMLFREAEGVTLIVPLPVAERLGLEHQYQCRMITCDVHSSLEAVGFMATIATKLAENGIPVNPVSGYYHDHLFVSVNEADRAVEILEEIREQAAAQ
ncbi:integron gene cassette protein [Exophiala viscosa]|uniref:Integron gene cassette protein n=1 Tax=Exophiala viscosa TaxID=2486360 RepID=A0AAN6E6H0_9EURO|nr:integron gene cassette protein [Exophiala viscosa]KAI1627486.1 integron gene cassette protein [Exophiala viscosa]